MTEQTMDMMQAPPPASAGSESSSGGAPETWFEGVNRVQAMPPPTGFAPDKWRQVQQDAATLLEQHGAELHQLGWTATDLFGVHPAAPAMAIHCVGLCVVFGGARVVEVTPERAAFVRPSGARLTYTRRSSPEAVPLWELRP